ncbi:hypothetical protein JL722_12789 [Aureococcus anophagefferens]|nr:hypothetical protein JL722_12789 [Aureococcus anophagefferens]
MNHAAFSATDRGATAWWDATSSDYTDYASSYDVMGQGSLSSSDLSAHFTAAGKLCMDWIDDAHVVEVAPYAPRRCSFRNADATSFFQYLFVVSGAYYVSNTFHDCYEDQSLYAIYSMAGVRPSAPGAAAAAAAGAVVVRRRRARSGPAVGDALPSAACADGKYRYKMTFRPSVADFAPVSMY